MKNRSDQINVLHISPQSAEYAHCIPTVAEKLRVEFQAVCADVRLKTVHAESGLPERGDFEKFDGLVISGSRNSVNDDLPWLYELKLRIVQALKRKKPTLGICFGHQLIAKTFGGKVERGNQGPKYGYFHARKMNVGVPDPLYDGIPAAFPISSWHEDVVTKLPAEVDQPVAVLVQNEPYANQSLSIGETIRTTQYHPEFDEPTFNAIADASPPIVRPVFPNEIDRELHSQVGNRILQNFIRHFVLKGK